MWKTSGVSAAVLAMALSTACGWAQATGSGEATSGKTLETFYLANVNQPTEANEIVTALRNLLQPTDKVYYVPSQNAIFVEGPPEQQTLTRKLLKDLDRPKKTFRLTYTISDMDGSKLVGTQHFSTVVVSGGRTVSKEGSKVPIVTGSYQASTGSQKQVTYLDIGINIDASLDESSDGLRLRTKVERSSVAEERSNVAAEDPVIRQTVLEGTANLVPGKALTLGSLDVVGSTRHLNVEVVAEAVR